MPFPRILYAFIMAFLCLALQAEKAKAQTPNKTPLQRIDHIVVVYLENHSFDNLYGVFPGAEGISHSDQTSIQVNQLGLPYQSLPPVTFSNVSPPMPDSRFPKELPNGPFNLLRYVQTKDIIPDMVHRFYQEQAEIDGGLMDKFALYSGAGGLPMGYYDSSNLPLSAYAKTYILGDHMFHAAFGGSFLNHFWLVCACTPAFPNAPADLTAQIDAKGRLVKDGAVTPDGYAVNTLEPVGGPHHANLDNAHLLPQQTMPTIGDRLSAKNVSWAWYAGGYNDALSGHPDKLFEVHHQPFLYFANYAIGTAGARDHLKDEADLIKAIDTDSLPSVAFWKPIGEDDEHPGYASLLAGDQHAADMIKRIHDSPAWKTSLIIVTYDENGGQWDHVPPPVKDRWGPGTRVPLIIVSPYALANSIDTTQYDTTSILRTIELRFGLSPLAQRDAQAAPLVANLSLPAVAPERLTAPAPATPPASILAPVAPAAPATPLPPGMAP